MAVVLVIEVEYSEALKEHRLELALRRADGDGVGPTAVALFNVGHPAGTEPGAPLSVPLALELPGVVFDTFGRYEWIVEVDGAQVGRLPIAVAPIPEPPVPSAPPTAPEPRS